MTDPVRFPAYPIPEKWAELYGVFAAMFAGDWALARQRWEASTKTPSGTYCTDCAGGIQYNFEQWQKGRVYPTQRTGISLTPGASPVTVMMQPNVCYLFGAGGDGNTDARDRRLQAGERRAQNFRLPDAAAASSSGGGGGMRDGTDRIAALGAQMYLDQWADLAKQAKQIQDDLLTQFEEGNEAAARATKEQVDTLERILSGTKSGQERATFKDLEALNDALIVGRINAEEYEEAYGTIQERLNEIRGVAKIAVGGFRVSHSRPSQGSRNVARSSSAAPARAPRTHCQAIGPDRQKGRLETIQSA